MENQTTKTVTLGSLIEGELFLFGNVKFKVIRRSGGKRGFLSSLVHCEIYEGDRGVYIPNYALVDKTLG